MEGQGRVGLLALKDVVLTVILSLALTVLAALVGSARTSGDQHTQGINAFSESVSPDRMHKPAISE